MDSSSLSSPQQKRHSFPAILTYSETLSVLSEHQREYNDREMFRRSCNTPTILANGNEEERQEKLQEATEWLKKELKDMYHQDKFLLRQFNHLNRTIQDLKEKQEMTRETSEKQLQLTKEQLKQDQLKQEHLKIEEHLKKEEHLKNEELTQEKRSLNEYDSDYGSDQSMDKFEEDFRLLKNNAMINVCPKEDTTKQRMAIKRWTWWK